MTLDEMAYQFFDTGWFDPNDRPKTALAMQHLIERVPDDVFDTLDVLVFAPGPHLYGQVYPGILPSKSEQPKTFIYLAPSLEEQSQQDVDFTVAHEFAHVYLNHEQAARNPSAIEDDADALVETWGFIIPARRSIK